MDKHFIKAIIDQYAPISDEIFTALAQHIQISTFPKGHQLVKEGQHSDKLFLILKGSAKAYYLKDGKVITDWFAFENDFICAINSYFLFIPSPHFIELLEDSTLLTLRRDDMLKLCDQYHEVERLTRITITKTMLQLQQRVVSLQFETAQQRYQSLLSIYPNIENRVPLGDIASFLGITQETLSRIRASKKRI
ncbi:CRP-like cAMP-binding protein [Arcicella aurantiaca]|uniref:CRP-like cAMP-binding protein n=1 Tax=Arcicella aurantiaca TaxID=591202 RepID=A0A316EE78_9BACT|nr:Crp/Fnr family transcriptional regulator [Arcicella aurantiaca]PWK27942.1 CRP-like cAMP-binding protein [Arcicella aurantiaca]